MRTDTSFLMQDVALSGWIVGVNGQNGLKEMALGASMAGWTGGNACLPYSLAIL